jgi:hypothetical protein
MSSTIEAMAAAVAEVWETPFFRGEIYDYAKKLDLQSGYAVKGPVDISTMRHLVEPLEAIRDPHVQLESITGAVQTTKSLIADITVAYWIENEPGDTLWFSRMMRRPGCTRSGRFHDSQCSGDCGDARGREPER